jgi:hypothetical protein
MKMGATRSKFQILMETALIKTNLTSTIAFVSMEILWLRKPISIWQELVRRTQGFWEHDIQQVFYNARHLRNKQSEE